MPGACNKVSRYAAAADIRKDRRTETAGKQELLLFAACGSGAVNSSPSPGKEEQG